jgi:hypothetical protein
VRWLQQVHASRFQVFKIPGKIVRDRRNSGYSRFFIEEDSSKEKKHI